MTGPEEIEPAKPESESADPEAQAADRPTDNPSVARCIRAFSRAYQKKLNELDEEDGESYACEEGRRHYLRAMPPLTGSANIGDFIACVTYASVAEIIPQPDADHYLAAAKVASAPCAVSPGPPMQGFAVSAGHPNPPQFTKLNNDFFDISPGYKNCPNFLVFNKSLSKSRSKTVKNVRTHQPNVVEIVGQGAIHASPPTPVEA